MPEAGGEKIAALDYRMVYAGIEDLVRRSFLYIHIEPTNSCNTTCVMCPRSLMVRPMRMLKWPVFEKIMALVLPSEIPMVSLVGFGEPTLHAGLADMIRYVRKHRPGMIIKVTTNGSRIAAKRMTDLYEAGLDLLEVSAVGHDAETYRNAMGGLEFSDLLELVDRLNAERRRYLLTTFPSGSLEPQQIKAFWQSRGVEHVAVKGFHHRGGYLESTRAVSVSGLGEYAARSAKEATSSCHKLTLFLHVNVEGNFIPCVQEINNRNILFRVDEVESIATLRAAMDAIRPEFDICSGCEISSQDLIDYYSRFLCTHFPQTALALQHVGSAVHG